MKSRYRIFLITLYISAFIAAQNSFVLCVKADGSMHFDLMNHCQSSCCENLHHHIVKHHETDHDSETYHDHCCRDYPVPVLPQLAVEKDTEVSCHDCIQIPSLYTTLCNSQVDSNVFSGLDISGQPQDHIDTFILLI